MLFYNRKTFTFWKIKRAGAIMSATKFSSREGGGRAARGLGNPRLDSIPISHDDDVNKKIARETNFIKCRMQRNRHLSVCRVGLHRQLRTKTAAQLTSPPSTFPKDVSYVCYSWCAISHVSPLPIAVGFIGCNEAVVCLDNDSAKTSCFAGFQ